VRTNADIVNDHYQASARGDIAGMMADIDTGVRWTEMGGFPYAGTWIGPEQVVERVFTRLTAEWTDFHFTLERLIESGASVVAVGTYAGTYKQTGKSMRARVAHVWRLQHGKVISFEQFADTLLVARAIN
jgi:ketosteroid isomerase-like protein